MNFIYRPKSYTRPKFITIFYCLKVDGFKCTINRVLEEMIMWLYRHVKLNIITFGIYTKLGSSWCLFL